MSFTFVDTVGLLALWDADDQWHEAAEAAWAAVLASGAKPCTTPFVLLECGNAASRRPYRPLVNSIRELFERAGTLIWPTSQEWRQAWQTYDQEKPGGAGIVDHVSFIVMRRLGIDDAFTNDGHFRTAGLHTLF